VALAAVQQHNAAPREEAPVEGGHPVAQRVAQPEARGHHQHLLVPAVALREVPELLHGGEPRPAVALPHYLRVEARGQMGALFHQLLGCGADAQRPHERRLPALAARPVAPVPAPEGPPPRRRFHSPCPLPPLRRPPQSLPTPDPPRTRRSRAPGAGRKEPRDPVQQPAATPSCAPFPTLGWRGRPVSDPASTGRPVLAESAAPGEMCQEPPALGVVE